MEPSTIAEVKPMADGGDAIGSEASGPAFAASGVEAGPGGPPGGGPPENPKNGEERSWSWGGIAENIWASAIALALTATCTGLVAYLLIEKSRNKIAQHDLRIQLIGEVQDVAEQFATTIPRQLAIQRRLWELAEEEVEDAAEGKSLFASHLGDLARQRERRELSREWRSQMSYIAACRLVSARVSDSDGYCESTAAVIGLLTERDPSALFRDSDDLLSRYMQMLDGVPEGSEASKILGLVSEEYEAKMGRADEQNDHGQYDDLRSKYEDWKTRCLAAGAGEFALRMPSTPPEGEGRERVRWCAKAAGELRKCSDWLHYRGGLADDLRSLQERRAEVERDCVAGKAPLEDLQRLDDDLARLGSEIATAELRVMRAFRRSAEAVADTLYVDTLESIGRYLNDEIKVVLEPDDEKSEVMSSK